MAYQEMIEEYEREECENLITLPPQGTNGNVGCEAAPLVMGHNGMGGIMDHSGKTRILPSSSSLLTNGGGAAMSTGFQQPRIPSHMAHSRTPSNGSNISIEPYYHHMNYHTHSRSASGNFNYGQTTTSMNFGGAGSITGGGGASGHVRTASGGGGIDLGKPWLPSHSRYCKDFIFSFTYLFLQSEISILNISGSFFFL